MVKQLNGQLADQKKTTKSEKGEQKSQTRYVIRSDAVKTQESVDPAKKAQIDKARGRIEELSKALQSARADLAKLEGNEARVTLFGTPSRAYRVAGAKPSESKDVFIYQKGEGGAKSDHTVVHGDVKVHSLAKPAVKVQDGKAIELKTFVHGKNEGDRIDALEQKLNKLLEEVSSLKKSKGD